MKSFFADEVVKPETLATWAAKNLSARIDAPAIAKLLGFAEHDIQILMASGRLIPLGDLAPNASKYFSAVEMIQLASDRDWLHKATKELTKHWKNKRERRTSPLLTQDFRQDLHQVLKRVLGLDDTFPTD